MIYVTGGAGFIGSNVVRMLQNDMHEVYIVDRLRSNGKWKNLVNVRFKDLIHPDEFNFDSIKKDDIVIHLGACSNTNEQDADFLWKNNVKYSISLIDKCVAAKARIIYASSASIYGNASYGFGENTTIHQRPLNAYGFSKWRVDEYVIRNKLESHVVGLRFFNVWGPGETHKGAMCSFQSRACNLLKNNQPITVYVDESKKLERDFIYIDDVCSLISRFIDDKSINGIYNIGTGEAIQWFDIAKHLIKIMNADSQLLQIAPLPEELKKHYQYSTKADISKLMKVFPDFKFTPIKEALERFVRHNEYK